MNFDVMTEDWAMLANMLSPSRRDRYKTENTYASIDSVVLSDAQLRMIYETAEERDAKLEEELFVFRDWLENYPDHQKRIISLVDSMVKADIFPSVGVAVADVPSPELKNGQILLPNSEEYYKQPPFVIFKNVFKAVTSDPDIREKMAFSLTGGSSAFTPELYEPSQRDAAKKNFINLVMDGYERNLFRNFAEGLKYSYTRYYSKYDASSPAAQTYATLFKKINGINKSPLDFAEIDSLYRQGAKFGEDNGFGIVTSDVPEEYNPIIFLRKIVENQNEAGEAGKGEFSAQDRKEALLRILRYSSSYNDGFAAPIARYLEDKKADGSFKINDVIQDIAKDLGENPFPERQAGLVVDDASRNYVYNSEDPLLKIERLLADYPPYASCVSILEAAKTLDSARLEALYEFALEATAEIRSYEQNDQDVGRKLIDLNTRQVEDLAEFRRNRWNPVKVRIENNLAKIEALETLEPKILLTEGQKKLIEDIRNYASPLNSADANDSIFFLNLENVSKALLASSEKGYFDAQLFSHFEEKLKEMETLHTAGSSRNRIIDIRFNRLSPLSNMFMQSKTGEESAEIQKAVTDSFARYLDQLPEKDWWKLEAKGYNPISYTRDFTSLIVREKDDIGQDTAHLQITYYNKDGMEIVVNQYGPDFHVLRGPNGEYPDFEVLMNTAALAREQGFEEMTFETDEPQYFRMMALALARHGILCHGPAAQLLSEEEKQEIQQIYDSFREESPAYFYDGPMDNKGFMLTGISDDWTQSYNNLRNYAELNLYGDARESALNRLEDDKKLFNDAAHKWGQILNDADISIQAYTMLTSTGKTKEEAKEYIAGLASADEEELQEAITLLGLNKEQINSLISPAYQNQIDGYYNEVFALTGDEDLAERFVRGKIEKAEFEFVLKKAALATGRAGELSDSLTDLYPFSFDEKMIAELAEGTPKTPSDANYAEYAGAQLSYINEELTKLEGGRYKNVINAIKLDIDDTKGEAFETYITAIQKMRAMEKPESVMAFLTEEIPSIALYSVKEKPASALKKTIPLADLKKAITAKTNAEKITKALYEEAPTTVAIDTLLKRIKASKHGEAFEAELEDFERRAKENSERYTEILLDFAKAYTLGEDDASKQALLQEVDDMKTNGQISTETADKIREGRELTGKDIDNYIRAKAVATEPLLSVREIYEFNQDKIFKEYDKSLVQGIKDIRTEAESLSLQEEAKRVVDYAIVFAANEIYEERLTNPLKKGEEATSLDNRVKDVLVKWCGADIRHEPFDAEMIDTVEALCKKMENIDRTLLDAQQQKLKNWVSATNSRT